MIAMADHHMARRASGCSPVIGRPLARAAMEHRIRGGKTGVVAGHRSDSAALTTRATAVPAHDPSEETEPEKRPEPSPEVPPRRSSRAGTPYRESGGEQRADGGNASRQGEYLAHPAFAAHLVTREFLPCLGYRRALSRDTALRICASHRHGWQRAIAAHVFGLHRRAQVRDVAPPLGQRMAKERRGLGEQLLQNEPARARRDGKAYGDRSGDDDSIRRLPRGEKRADSGECQCDPRQTRRCRLWPRARPAGDRVPRRPRARRARDGWRRAPRSTRAAGAPR